MRFPPAGSYEREHCWPVKISTAAIPAQAKPWPASENRITPDTTSSIATAAIRRNQPVRMFLLSDRRPMATGRSLKIP